MRSGSDEHSPRLHRRLLATCALAALAAVAGTPRQAAAGDVQLNFATVNQSLWSPGGAIVLDGSVALPDPAAAAHLNLAAQDISPTGALLSLIGLNSFGPDVTINPSGDFSAQLSAYYHLNSGSISLEYPKEVQLNLPTNVQSGQAFQVGLSNPNLISPFSLSSQTLQALSATGGAGYGLSSVAALIAAGGSGAFAPIPGFTTVSPFAQAGLRADLSAGASIHASACLGFGIGEVCPFTGNIDLGSTSLNTQILQLSSLTGLQILDQPVIGLSNQHVDLPGGLGSVTFNSPSLNLQTDTLRAGGVLADSGAVSFMSLGLDVDQMVPLVGQILHNSLGPFGYDLLSVEPTLSLTLHQALTFTPQVVADLHFSEPVICMTCAGGGNPVRDLSLALGQNETLMPATIGTLGGTDLQVTTTYRLQNTFQNTTYVSLDGSLAVQALALTAPVTEGPAYDPPPLQLFSLPLYVFGDQAGTSFQLNVPSITTAANHIEHTGNIGALLSVSVEPDVALNDQGHHQYALSKFLSDIGQFSAFAFVYGQLFTQPGPGCFLNGEVAGDCPDEQYFLADSDVFNGDTDLGRLLCLSCQEVAGSAANPFLLDDAGNPVYLSDLSSFNAIATATDVVDPNSPFYDPVLATSQFYQQVSTREGGTVTADVAVDEPGVLALMGLGLVMLCLRRQRSASAWPLLCNA